MGTLFRIFDTNEKENISPIDSFSALAYNVDHILQGAASNIYETNLQFIVITGLVVIESVVNFTQI